MTDLSLTATPEIEFKLEAAAIDLDRLAAAPLLADAAFVDRIMTSTYFDDPGLTLRAAGVTLRVRQIGDRFVQTIKADGGAAAGLFTRPEWERDVAGPTPVLDDAADPLATLLPPAALHALTPVFTVTATRRMATVMHQGSAIEVAIDRATVRAGEQSDDIAEIELELKSGTPAALFALAREMNAVAPMRIGVLTKSERGYRLLGGKAGKPVKAEALTLARTVTTGDAFTRIVAACLRQFRLNEDIFAGSDAPEALHQARVALRRLRSALAIFKPVLGADPRFDHLRAELRWLAATLGELRDIDVLRAGRGIGHGEALARARAVALDVVRAALASHRASALMIELTEWTAIGAWRSDPDEAALRDGPAAAFAAVTLDRLRRRIRRRGRALAALDDAERHDVRILAKKLRYAAGFFASLFTGKKARRRRDPYVAAIEKLQKHLGDLNDIAHGPTVLARLGLPATSEDQAPRRAVLIDKAAAAQEALADAKPFWR